VLATGPSAELAVEAHLVLADLYRRTGTPAAAQEHAEAAHSLAERLHSPRLIGVAHAALARVTALSDDQTNAARAFEQALDLLATARTPFERALVLQAYAVDLVGQRDRERARAMLDEALAVLERIGARPAADRCRALRESLNA